MALTTIDTNSIGDGDRYDSGVDDSDYLVLENVLVGSTGPYPYPQLGFDLWGSHHDLEVRGYVSGGIGIRLGGDIRTSTGNVLHITDTGQVQGTSGGVVLIGSASLVNEGSIWGAEHYGVDIELAAYGTTEILNSGEIASLRNAVWVAGSMGPGTVRLTNDGVITGGRYSFVDAWGEVTDIVTNRGLMVGDVVLGGGNDLFDNRGGEVRGTIFGYDGDDLFRPGRSAETIDGGTGFDTLDLRSNAGLRVSLADPSLNTREAKGDSYIGIERILGSRFADMLTGDDLANTLAGRGGQDLLTGGSGDDSFEYFSSRDGGDRILDFGNAPGDDDQFLFRLSGFGAGLDAGTLDAAQFHAGTRNWAMDADDRFIFRTTDESLWFDRDGRGGGASVLIADLQDGAVLTSEDIQMVLTIL